MLLLKTLKPADRKKAEQKLRETIDLRKRQIGIIEKDIISPLEKNIRTAKKAIKNECSLEQFAFEVETLNKLLKDILGDNDQ